MELELPTAGLEHYKSSFTASARSHRSLGGNESLLPQL